jgi:hypothetical protein
LPRTPYRELKQQKQARETNTTYVGHDDVV